jgi:hypothetical protein
MLRKVMTYLTAIAFIAAVFPAVAAGSSVKPRGLISKGTKLSSEEQTQYKLLAAQSAPSLRRAGTPDDTGHYIVLTIYTALVITAIIIATTGDDAKPASAAPPPPL